MSGKSQKYRWQCESFEVDLLSETLGPDHCLDPGRHRREKFEIYDSFDRGFLSVGLALVRAGGRFRVIDDEDLVHGPVSSDQLIRHHRPVFYWDFEDGEFQGVLRSHLKLRAALALASIELEDQEFCVRNGDGKIVLRLWQRKLRSEGREDLQTMTAVPLVGYEGEAERIAAKISDLAGFDSKRPSFKECMTAVVGEPSSSLSAKEVIPIRSDQSVQQAVTKIAEFMVRVASQCEDGVIKDIDTEYLHDYRVAIRKLRSVISLVKGAYPVEDTARLKEVFAEHAKATNRLRDLDVYLLKESDFRARLPVSLRPGLDRMFSDFRIERRRVLGSVRRRLSSQGYKDEMDREFDWLGRENLPRGSRAEEPVGKVVVDEIKKRYRLVRRLGMALDKNTPDEEVHELRLECKRLRYLLELFASLFPRTRLKPILMRLRALQDILGEFNDCCVQSESMEAYLSGAEDLDKDSAAAVGGLIAVLHAKQLEARAGVTRRFEKFCDGKMKQRFKALFAGIKAPES